MATVYGNTYTGDGYGEQVYLDYSVSQTGSKFTVTAKAGIKATTKAISIDTSAMLVDSVMCGIYTGSYQSTDYDSNQKAFTLSKGSTKQLVYLAAYFLLLFWIKSLYHISFRKAST